MNQIIQAVIPFNEIAFYPFNWLDELLEIKTNVASTLYMPVTTEDITAWKLNATSEIDRVARTLKQQVFGEYTVSKIRPVVDQYLDAIAWLLSLVANNLGNQATPQEVGFFLESLSEQLNELSARLEKRYEKYLTAHRKKQSDEIPFSKIQKLVCNLSGDQVGIMLKAADDTKLVLARSISMVYKTIIPWLSTTQKSELSWNSIRSNSYHPEQGDKDIVIAALEKMIRVIRDYR